ncbi:MAG: nucleotide exchange factor GrpE [Alistipes sp.]|nr:nucleotide exchange factor GrpE [Alistipes sp.]
MSKEKVYNEAIEGDEGFNEGEGYPSCEGQPCANVADETDGQSDIMTEDADSDRFAEAEKDAGQEKTATSDGTDALHAELDQWKDKFLRLQAEFDNYRKRTLKEKMDLVQTGGRDVLLAMLPVHDDIARAVAAMEKSDDVEALRSGVVLIAQKFTEALRQKGVTAIEVNGKEFDPETSEAVARFAAGDEMKGRVVDTVQTGYMLGDKVLRFAKVVVGE